MVGGVLELMLIVCEGATEVQYFNILKRRFRLPTWIKIIPDMASSHRTLGQHEHLIDVAILKQQMYANELGAEADAIETWVVCDRDEYSDSFSKLKQYADERGVELAFSDPQFENYLLQHFSANKSSNRGHKVIEELSGKIDGGLYKKSDLSWLDDMIDKKHSVVGVAARNAAVFSNHTKQPFFTVQNLVFRIMELGNIAI